VFLLLALIHTWPLVTGLDHLSRHNDDEWLNAWAVSWVAHQLPRDPLRLFEANIFYPHERALAYTEPLIVPGVIGAPIRWLGGSPLLTYNVLLLLGLTLTALAMYALVVNWSGDHWGGLLAGALLAFSTPMLTRLPHLQILHFYWLPFACLALDRLLTRRRTSDAVWLGVCVLGAALTSGYLVVYVTFALAGALLARAKDWWGWARAGVLLRLAAAAAVTLAILLVIMRPYQELQLRRPLTPEAASVGAALESYLSSAARVHYSSWSQPIFDRAPGILFPGVIALTLAAICLLGRRRIAQVGTRRVLVAIALVGVILSLGPLTPIYVWMYHAVPPLQGLRSPIRFGIVALFALAALAGLGLSMLRRWVSPNWRPVGSFAIIALATMESIHGPISYTTFEWNPPIYEALRAADPGPVVELPIYGPDNFHRNARYLLASTTHWRPLVNGFGGFRPPGYNDMALAIDTFPSLLAVARLQALRVRHVVVHTASYRRPENLRRALRRLERQRVLVLLAEEGPDRLYRIADLPRTRVRTLLFGLPWSELTFVRVQSPGSYLRGSHRIGRTFGLQWSGQFLAHLENTRPNSRLMLRPLVQMTGMFLDGFTGDILGEVTVEAPSSTDPPTSVAVPPGRRAVLLHLRPTE
jgi:hypothetical protein